MRRLLTATRERRPARHDERGSASDLALLLVVALVVLALIVGILAAVIYTVKGYHHHETRTCTVVSKDRTTDPKGGSDARVYTADCGVLQVADATFDGHFNSADTYATITPGHRYVFHTIGYRVPWLSDFPNILSATEVQR